MSHKAHPSLTGAFDLPPPLQPQHTMEPYTPCWCGSGSKWKFCHKLRERERRRSVGEYIAAMREACSTGYCSHPNAGLESCTRIVRAHTVQRRGGLSEIAEEGHVLSVKAASERLFENEGTFVPQRVGIRSASTFLGFCERHDGEMFRPIESQTPSPTRANAFLFAYRAMAYELYQKRFQLDLIPFKKRELDKGESFKAQAWTQEYLHLLQHGAERGLKDLLAWKRDFDRMWLESDFGDFEFFGMRFQGSLPLAACGALYVEFDLEGRPLQKVGAGDAPLEHITLTIASSGASTLAVLGWLERKGGVAQALVDSFKRVPMKEKANAVAHFAFEHLENVFLRPSWWDHLSPVQKAAADARFRSGLPFSGRDRTGDALADRDTAFLPSIDCVDWVAG